MLEGGKGHQPKWKMSLGVLRKAGYHFYNVEKLEISQNQIRLQKREWLTFPALQPEWSEQQATRAAHVAWFSTAEQSLA